MRRRKVGQHKSGFRKQLPLQLFVLAGILYLSVFNIIPMAGLVMGFKDYKITDGWLGIFTAPWVGLKFFREFVTDFQFPVLVRNTVGISLCKLIFTFPLPIAFAVMLSDMRRGWFRKLTQTASYLPHFISWVIISGISYQFLSSSGILNRFLLALHVIKKPIGFLTDAGMYWGLATVLDMWKETGWWAIVFLAAIMGINMEMYESAILDGASRLQRVRYITLPSIKPTIVTVLILALGNLFGGGLGGSNFEQSYLLGNAMNSEASGIIQTYVYDVGLANGRYAYAAAVGMVQSVISLIFVFVSNAAAKRTAGSSLF
ncbi:ABC transporter permease [Lachnoclostridium sp. Marseille-P6806]|uniref:ABC transporter permease n=1 Tax=Lachnoclostridium sp. Marseille-P6806 TaxID=2364793 RepID=UPI0010316C85|nr:ABC transporter permease subunit [Lachnoclostridium sp. Marseille-P6806]